MISETIIRFALRKAYQLNLHQTQIEYNDLAAKAFTGIGIIGFISLLILPVFPFKIIVYAFVGYCFVMPLHYRLAYPGYPLWWSMLQVPIGLFMIVSLQAIMPKELVHMTAFLYPLVFVFSFHFHSTNSLIILFTLTFSISTVIVAYREIYLWPVYVVTTFGGTLTIGVLVHATVSRVLKFANYDALTGLMNRRYWEDSTDHLIEMSRRNNQSLTIVFFDLDKFKSINDRQGHPAGDQVLQEVGKQLELVSRKIDNLARWGGDEFAIAMPNTHLKEAASLIQRLQQKLPMIEISAGVVQLLPEETLNSLLTRADREMYAVKKSKQRPGSNKNLFIGDHA